jgi:hypothetical protein
MVEHPQRNTKKTNSEMMDSMTQNAKNSGLDFHFEKIIIHLMRIACYIWQRNITYQIR